MALARWEPLFREMEHLRSMMERFFEEPFAPLETAERTRLMPVDMYETDNELVIKTSVPGMRPEDIDISITGNTVTIRGERRELREIPAERWLRRERFAGRFYREITLPYPVDAEHARATFENGELTLTLPKAAAARVTKVKVETRAG
jgi:HSP20 family protein